MNRKAPASPSYEHRPRLGMPRPLPASALGVAGGLVVLLLVLVFVVLPRILPA